MSEPASIESAIPAHLRCPRSRPRRIPDDYAPPYPAYVARYPRQVEAVVMAYLGVQFEPAQAAAGQAALAELDARLDAADGPAHRDRARGTDSAGFDNVLSVAYWSDAAAWERWQAAFEPWWSDAARERGAVGLFIEAFVPRAEQFETLFSTVGRMEGAACLAPRLSGTVQEHAYWGGARERIALAQTDALAPAGALQREALSERRVRVRGHDNLCLIRSGQDWSETAGEERALYLAEMEPVLREGMDYLRDAGLPIGCYSNRYLRVLGEDGRPVEKSYGLGCFRSLAELERWSESHPTHLAIFGTFMRIVQKLNFDLKLRLYHEVSVVSAEATRFEYVGCHPGTGLLAAV